MKGFVFDLDGVIVSTDNYHYLAWKALADEIGVYFDKEINNRLRGVSRMDSLEIILEKSDKEYSLKEKEDMCEKKNRIYQSYLKNMSDKNLSADVLSTLNELRRRGYKMAIGSSSKNTKLILEQIGLSSFFDEIVDGTMISKTKPDPEVFLKAASLLGLDPKDCYVVEDAIAGIEAGYRGGFKTIAISDARKSELATNKIEKFSDILSLVE